MKEFKEAYYRYVDCICVKGSKDFNIKTFNNKIYKKYGFKVKIE